MSLEYNRHYTFGYGPILVNAPRDSGIYALFRDQEWLYVGQADSIFTGLLDRLEQDGSELDFKSATEFAFEVCPPERRGSRLAEVVFKCRPVYTERPELMVPER